MVMDLREGQVPFHPERFGRASHVPPTRSECPCNFHSMSAVLALPVPHPVSIDR
jgi:hypothetical protein